MSAAREALGILPTLETRRISRARGSCCRAFLWVVKWKCSLEVAAADKLNFCNLLLLLFSPEKKKSNDFTLGRNSRHSLESRRLRSTRIEYSTIRGRNLFLPAPLKNVLPFLRTRSSYESSYIPVLYPLSKADFLSQRRFIFIMVDDAIGFWVSHELFVDSQWFIRLRETPESRFSRAYIFVYIYIHIIHRVIEIVNEQQLDRSFSRLNYWFVCVRVTRRYRWEIFEITIFYESKSTDLCPLSLAPSFLNYSRIRGKALSTGWINTRKSRLARK